MGAVTENLRGAWACALWLAGTPLLNYRMAHKAASKADARAMLQAHIAKFLKRCRVDYVVERPPPEITTGCVVCYNEASFIDLNVFPMVMWPYIDRGVAADIYRFFPWGRPGFANVGLEMVPRGNRKGTDRLIARIVAAVKTGERVAWGGEGRIVGIDGVGRFKIGSSLVAIRAQVPIVPVVFYGGHHVMPFPSVRLRPGRVHVHFGEPVCTQGLTEEDARGLADRLQAHCAQTYEDLREKSLAYGA